METLVLHEDKLPTLGPIGMTSSEYTNRVRHISYRIY
jgi:hypothetical protein